jgi:hypothetical protein
MRHRRLPLCCLALPALGRRAATAADRERWPELASGWALQSSVKLNASGPAVSQVALQAVDWHTVAVPSTVVDGLVRTHANLQAVASLPPAALARSVAMDGKDGARVRVEAEAWNAGRGTR